MADAVAWLQDNFGMTPRGGASSSTSSYTPRGTHLAQFTPRGKAYKDEAVADNAVMHAAMQAALSTPRAAEAGRRSSVDDTAMHGAVSKMFHGKLQVL